MYVCMYVHIYIYIYIYILIYVHTLRVHLHAHAFGTISRTEGRAIRVLSHADSFACQCLSLLYLESQPMSSQHRAKPYATKVMAAAAWENPKLLATQAKHGNCWFWRITLNPRNPTTPNCHKTTPDPKTLHLQESSLASSTPHPKTRITQRRPRSLHWRRRNRFFGEATTIGFL